MSTIQAKTRISPVTGLGKCISFLPNLFRLLQTQEKLNQIRHSAEMRDAGLSHQDVERALSAGSLDEPYRFAPDRMTRRA